VALGGQEFKDSPIYRRVRRGKMGRLGGHNTWARRAGLHRAHALAADGKLAMGQGGNGQLRVERTRRGHLARVLSSRACSERHSGEVLQCWPRATGVCHAAGDRGAVNRVNQAGRGWTSVVVST
jgi:hypothetical protein